jgi:hypothetical protein
VGRAAHVAELADALASGASGETRTGSSPVVGTLDGERTYGECRESFFVGQRDWGANWGAELGLRWT